MKKKNDDFNALSPTKNISFDKQPCWLSLKIGRAAILEEVHQKVTPPSFFQKKEGRLLHCYYFFAEQRWLHHGGHLCPGPGLLIVNRCMLIAFEVPQPECSMNVFKHGSGEEPNSQLKKSKPFQ